MLYIIRSMIVKWCCIFYFLIPILCNGNMIIILDDLVDPELENNIHKQLSGINFNIINTDLDFQEQLKNIIRSRLKPLGYYNSIIEISIDSNNITNNKLIIKINLGKPVIVAEVNLHIFGDGQYDCDYQKIMQDSVLFLGKKLNHNDYEQFKNKIYNLAMSKGYFDAKFQKSHLVVIPSIYKSIWNIDFNSGQRYLFEDINFKGNQIKLDYLKNICNISPGEYYDIKSILELNKRLSSTNWFESIVTSSDFVLVNQKKNWY